MFIATKLQRCMLKLDCDFKKRISIIHLFGSGPMYIPTQLLVKVGGNSQHY